MSIIPIGSLIFTGFGNAGSMRFYSPTGTNLGQPASAPDPGSGAQSICTIKPTHEFATVGGGSPNFPTTGVGIFNPDGTVRAEGSASPSGFGGRGSRRDDNGYFYGIKESTARIFRWNRDGTQIASWLAAPAAFSGHIPSAIGVAVNGAGTIAYSIQLDSTVIGATFNTIYAWDLVGNTDLGVFVTRAVPYGVLECAILALTNGDVLIGWGNGPGAGAGDIQRYNAAGVLQQTIALSGSFPRPVALAPGLTDATFWAVYYDILLSTYSLVRVEEFDIATGLVVAGHAFTPEDGTFDFDSGITVVLTAIGSLPAPTPPAPVLVNSTPCCGTSGSSGPTAGATAEFVGPDWTPACTGGGVVPTASDLAASEVWDY